MVQMFKLFHLIDNCVTYFIIMIAVHSGSLFTMAPPSVPSKDDLDQALLSACLNGYAHVAVELLEHGAGVNAKLSVGGTVFVFAARTRVRRRRRRCWSTLQVLKRGGPDQFPPRNVLGKCYLKLY